MATIQKKSFWQQYGGLILILGGIAIGALIGAFAPSVGTTIKQKERSINFTERSYLTVLQSYNEALLRKKNLEMTSATLKVLNEPTYPIEANSTNRKQIVIAACVAIFVIIIALPHPAGDGI